MINQSLNIANLYRQAKFELLDENEKLNELKEEVDAFKQFQQELKGN